jgi:peptide/nickel transport system substrate-binding protein
MAGRHGRGARLRGGAPALALWTGALLALSVTACGSGKPAEHTEPRGTLTVGTAYRAGSLDPAGSGDPGAVLVQNSVYQYLLSVPAGGSSPQPDAADSCRFTSETQYTCILKSGLNFSNGDTLTATDVAFSFNRVLRIADPHGPAALLDDMASVQASNLSTVVFTLKRPNDPTWPWALGSAAGAIVDSKVFSANALLDDAHVIGSGPYLVHRYTKGQLVELTANSAYSGSDQPTSPVLDVRYYSSATQLRADLQSGLVDVAVGGLSPTDVAGLQRVGGARVLSGHGSSVHALGFDLRTTPGSAGDQQLAVRQAIAYSLDRQELVAAVFRATAEPAYSVVPPGVSDATTPFKDAFGSTPAVAHARSVLESAGVTTPVTLRIVYPTGSDGAQAAQECVAVERQLEATRLFDVTVDGVGDADFAKGVASGAYPAYLDVVTSDAADADAYLATVLDAKTAGGQVADLFHTEQTTGGGRRAAALAQLQKILATGALQYVPLVALRQVAVVRAAVTGVQDTLDATGHIRLWLFGKG